MNSTGEQTTGTVYMTEKAARKVRFWNTFQIWDAIITWAWVAFIFVLTGIFIADAICQWNTHTMWTVSALAMTITMAIYGWGAMKLKTYLLIRLFIALLLTAPLAFAIYLAIYW